MITRGKRRSRKKRMADGRKLNDMVGALRDFLYAYGVGHAGDAGRKAFAKRCGTSPAYLSQIGLGYRKASLSMALAIERASYGQVPAKLLCRDADWAQFVGSAKKYSSNPVSSKLADTTPIDEALRG